MIDIQQFTPPLQKKVNQSLKFLKSIPSDNEPIELCYSGGKDSDVILRLAKEAGVNYRCIYRNTTIDPPGTVKHCKDVGAEIRMPERSFFELIEEHGLPNRFRRFCCGYLKEYKILNRSIIGIRRCESSKRSERYKEPTICRFYGKKKEENRVEHFYPILEWTDEDVEEFITKLGIKCAPVYYQNGSFDVKQRLGCMGCPMTTEKRRIETFKKYPNMVKCYIRACKRYWNSHPESTVHQRYDNVYEWFVRDVFFHTQKEWEEHKNNMFGKADYKSFLQEQFNIKL